MEHDIDFLINELEEERTKLKRLIKDAVAEGEYLIAHYHDNALAQVTMKLQTLKNLDDKLYEQKKMLRSLIRRSEEMLNGDHAEGFKKYLQHQMAKDAEELKQLDNRGKEPAPQSNILDQHVGRLLEKKLKYVRIFLKKSEAFCLEIRRSKRGLKVAIPNLKSLRRTYLMNDDNLQKFVALGFRTTNDGRKLVLLLALSTEDMINRLKTIIAIIVFEIFYFAEFERESFIEIGE